MCPVAQKGVQRAPFFVVLPYEGEDTRSTKRASVLDVGGAPQG